MTDSFCNLEDEAFPSFLSSTLGSASGRATLGNVTLGSGLGLPVAASTVAKIRAGVDNRGDAAEASYLDEGQIPLSTGEPAKFALSFKDDMDGVDDFIAAHRLSDMLVKVHLDETEPNSRVSALGPTSLSGRPTEQGTELSTGLLTFAHLGHKDTLDAKSVQAPPLPAAVEEDNAASDGADSDRFSGSVSSFLANEKLMSVDSMNSDISDNDIDVNNLPDDELELYFNKLVPPAMQRGRVEGQEIPAAGLPGAPDTVSNSSSPEPERNRYQFLDDYDQDDFQMPDVRLAATGMDSCPASDEEDTEDELEAARRQSTRPRTRLLLPSTSRQLVGESNRPSFRPGLEGGSSDDEPSNAVGASGIEQRRSAEGQVINPPVTGDGGGGDGSSGSEESGNDGGVSTLPLPPAAVQTTYDALRGLGIVGSSSSAGEDVSNLNSLSANGWSALEMGDRVGPVGTGQASGGPQRPSLVNWSMSLDRQEALDAMDNTEPAATQLDSVYLRSGAGHRRLQDATTTQLQGVQGSFHLSQVGFPECEVNDDEDEGVDEADGARRSMLLRGGPCGDVAAAATTAAQPYDSNSEDDNNLLSTSLDAKYFSQSFHQEQGDSEDDWNHRPDNLELEFQQGAAQSVVYQDEDGKWVTDLAYYSSFEKEVDSDTQENVQRFQSEDFVPACDAIEKIIEDQEEFEKEHQFMQEEQIEAASGSPDLANTSWKLPANSCILMRNSQVASEFEQGNQSYLRLSLGQFFEQRSEALGCLGSNCDEDGVKRPSFGYIITSPEKREPFPLIRPSDFPSSRDTSVHSQTVELSEADRTLNPEDLDQTLEALSDGVSRKGDTEPEPCRNEDVCDRVPLPADPKGSGSASGSADQSCLSPQNSSDLMLSINTIASAIADASISSDPSQLAAMILELSKRSRARSQGRPTAAATAAAEEPASGQDSQPLAAHTVLLDTLQKSLCAGEVSTFDIEKYLRAADMSGSSSDASASHSTFNLTGWADHLSHSHDGSLVVQARTSARQVEDCAPPQSHGGDREEDCKVTVGPPATSQPVCHQNTCSTNKANSRRSAIPRPKGSCIPTPVSSSARRSVGSGQSSMVKPSTNGKPVSAAKTAAVDGKASSATKPEARTAGPIDRNFTQKGTVHPQVSVQPSSKTLQGNEDSLAASPDFSKASQGARKKRSGMPCPNGASLQTRANEGQRQQERPSSPSEEKFTPGSRVAGLPPHDTGENRIGKICQTPPPPQHRTFDVVTSSSAASVAAPEDQECNFRPSTSPLTHSSPSNTSGPSADGTMSPPSSLSQPGYQLSPESTCSSPSLSRLTYISVNDTTVLPTPERQKTSHNMSLSTTIIRASPTPPVEPDTKTSLDILSPSKSLDQLPPHQAKALDPLPGQSKSPEPRCQSKSPDLRSGSALSCTRSQSECNHCCSRNGLLVGHGQQKCNHESGVRTLTKVDSGYSSNLNIQQPGSTAAGQTSQQWRGSASVQAGEAYPGAGFGRPPSYSSEDLRYVPISSFKPQAPVLVDVPHHGGLPTALLAGRALFSSQLAQQYLGPDTPLHPGTYHVGAGSGLYPTASTGMTCSDLAGRNLSNPSVPLAGPGSVGLPAGYHPLHRPHQNQQDLGMMGMTKPFSQHGVALWATGGLEELGGQVVVPEELRFPHACCVGIASQTSLSIFNPSERWLQVSIAITSLAINGEKVDSLPYQWLIVKNKTIIGPQSTEEQKILLVPPQAGVYQFVLSVSSWPAAAENELAARAQVFAKRVVLVAVAETPALEVDAGPAGILDFGDLSGGSAKSLPLKLLNRTHATVPIRLVISANATAWRCFTFSKSPVAMTAEGTLQAGHMTQLSAPSVVNHVMHPSYGESPDSFMVWVHFQAPQKYTSSSGELGPADDYSARVDVEVDCPGPSHVISSIPLRARSGIARVHAPKDLQTVSLSAPLGGSSQQTLPLKNAGNIDVQLRLKSSDAECFCVKPEELLLRAGEEQGIEVLYTPQGSKKIRESVLTILVLPSGPQYEVSVMGRVVPEVPSSTAAPALGPGVVLPILSNKQFMAWGGVTLGRAVQQKVVLRNNCPSSTMQLSLLIRGQDQDCFQLQSMFTPEERLTRHGELSIRPREDVAVHLLFAPTRVACMLAKLVIKQSGVRPSQPGVKFTIPLSGYGGTANIILEDQRKEADGYAATLLGVSPGRVSKACLCVRNTGSRAAFVKAAAYSDVQARAAMEPSVVSLSPSQFVLKERTQEVITVLMKSTEREQDLCGSARALLATVCLFCGDEVSRQQYRRLLQNKPEAGRKVLSENSLLKNIDFNEKFLGEEQVTEAWDLPQRPNEAQLFYGNMSKVVVSLMGTTDTFDSGESNPVEMPQGPARHGTETDSVVGNGSVSLDVLPVKGPQGPALRVPEDSMKTSDSSGRSPDSWSLQPEQLVLVAPTINGATNTQQVQIRNQTSRELTFELSWPAHCLTITPQHGLIEPQCHLQILISPNPSLATKPALLPWTGRIYVQCDNQQKFIKVQIRRDLALDVSAAPADGSLAALDAQAATPLPPLVRPQVRAPQPPHAPRSPPALLEVHSKTVVFPATPSGETSESHLEVENGQEEVRWYLSSFAPPYVKGVDNSGDVYRATYTAFRCSRVSGTLGARQKMQVPISFLPRDRGDYAQFWDLECHPVSEPQQKTRIRFQLCGTGLRSGSVEGPQEGDCSLVKTDASVKTRRRPDAPALKTGQEEAPRRGVYSPQDQYTFPVTRVGESSSLKVNVRNSSSDTHELTFVNPKEPFHMKHSKYSLRSQHYLKLPVQFKPTVAGMHTGLLLIQSETGGSLLIQLVGEALL